MVEAISAGGSAGCANCIDGRCTAREELLNLQARVDPIGADATVTMHTTKGQIELVVPIGNLAAAGVEIGQAGILMLQRRMKHRDHGKSAFVDLIRAAPKPESVTPMIDKDTGECIVVYRFADRLPFTVRLTMDQISEVRDALSSEVKTASN